MKTLVLHYVELENYTSFRELTQVHLSTSAGLKFIAGTNLVEPQLGPNGAGKTSFWSAICWCLYGTSLRDRRAADLASWGNTAPRVMIGLQIDGVSCSFERLGSPNRLYYNGELCDQSKVTEIVGLSRLRFVHSVIFGQAAKLFYDLGVTDRGNLIDEICNLELWMHLSDDAATSAQSITKQITTAVNQVTFTTGKLEGLTGRRLRIEEQATVWQASRNQDIEARINEIDALENQWNETRAHLEHILTSLRDVPDLDTLHKDFAQYKNLRNIAADKLNEVQRTATQLKQHMAFLNNNKVCPQCHQVISDAVKLRESLELAGNLHIAENDCRLWQSNVERQVQAVVEITQLRDETRSWLEDIDNKKLRVERNLDRLRWEIDAKVNEVNKLIDTPANPFTESLYSIDEEAAALQTSLTVLNTELQELQGRHLQLDYWRTGFRKLRLFMIKQVLARLEIETANAASALGLMDWQIRFTTEVETKAGTLKPGVHITTVEPGGATCVDESAGEEQRVRLAVAIGLSSLIQSMAGVDIKFEVYDEPSAALSQEGIDSLLTTLSERAISTGKSIWLLDHHVLSYGDFVEQWRVTKTQAGSRISMEVGRI